MTILPKKKSSQARSESESNTDGSPLQHLSVGSNNHLSHIGPVPQVTEPLNVARLSGRTSTSHTHSHGHSSQSSSRYEDYDLESGPSQTKRRMRVSPHRAVRPKHRDRNSSTSAIPSTSSAIHNVASSSSSGSSPTPSHVVPEPSSSYHCEDESGSGYNSGDEYGPARSSSSNVAISEEEWEQKERWFEKKMRKRGFIIKRMGEDGACLFRAVSDQIYGDQEMHSMVRKHCMDYIDANGDYFSQYMTEDFAAYVSRKRLENVHGNHIEMQAMSEMYNRHIEVFCYSVDPINIFHGKHQTDDEPIRLSYHRGVHYNSLVDPYKATVGVGLGLPGFVPGQADKKLMGDAMRQSEETLIEQAMLEDKVKATDWEATNEAIEEQVARESYLDWLRENERRNRQQQRSGHSATTSSNACELRSPRTSAATSSARNSPKPSFVEHQRKSPNASPRASTSRSVTTSSSRDGSSASPIASPAAGTSNSVTVNSSKPDWGLGPGFELAETASFLGQLPPDMFADWEDAGLLAQVLAASQQEYLDKLKKSREPIDETKDSPKEQQEEKPIDQSSRDSMMADPSSDLTTANGTNNIAGS
ncbi:OTU domain-containing protein 5-B-like isoform X2 [Daphnia carinata]|uniref:OTU domain-containing protein 5-B-like isoform X2 n=1 Tax=Daphnia carinata TaxID=120202 RepID=UPI0028694501|nr:OTU domain-containing protein 5-B-like isoform X2 [Daphnia carinata]